MSQAIVKTFTSQYDSGYALSAGPVSMNELFKQLVKSPGLSGYEKLKCLLHVNSKGVRLCSYIPWLEERYPGSFLHYLRFLKELVSQGVPVVALAPILFAKDARGDTLGFALLAIKPAGSNVYWYLEFLNFLLSKGLSKATLWQALTLSNSSGKTFGNTVHYFYTQYNFALDELLTNLAADAFDQRLVGLLQDSHGSGYPVFRLIQSYHANDVALIFTLLERGYLAPETIAAFAVYKEVIRDYLFRLPHNDETEVQHKAHLLLRSIDKYDPLGQFFYIQRDKSPLGLPADLNRGTLKQLYDYQKAWQKKYIVVEPKVAAGQSMVKVMPALSPLEPKLEVSSLLNKEIFTCKRWQKDRV